MNSKISIPAASVRDPGKSETTTVRDEADWDCDELQCTGTEAEVLTPHFHMVVTGNNPQAGPRLYRIAL